MPPDRLERLKLCALSHKLHALVVGPVGLCCIHGSVKETLEVPAKKDKAELQVDIGTSFIDVAVSLSAITLKQGVNPSIASRQGLIHSDDGSDKRFSGTQRCDRHQCNDANQTYLNRMCCCCGLSVSILFMKALMSFTCFFSALETVVSSPCGSSMPANKGRPLH